MPRSAPASPTMAKRRDEVHEERAREERRLRIAREALGVGAHHSEGDREEQRAGEEREALRLIEEALHLRFVIATGRLRDERVAHDRKRLLAQATRHARDRDTGPAPLHCQSLGKS
jgi:hypothetical protein